MHVPPFPFTARRRAGVLAAALLFLTAAAPALATAPPEPGRWPASVQEEGHQWPTAEAAELVRDYSPPPVPWAVGHRGVDLALPVGTPVRASAAGTVAFAGTVVDRPVVSVQHRDGVRTTYEPVVPLVKAGEDVSRGQVIGLLAAGHCEAGCLHWGARRGADDYLDPLSLLRALVRLLPL